jgi:Phage integrase, N-terminal SAM-like domain
MLRKHHPDDERIKREYLTWLKGAKGQSAASVDAVAKALSRFEADTKYADFKTFRREQAMAFSRHIAEQRGQRSGEALSKATIHTTLSALRKFFQWLSGQPGYRSHLIYSDADYFRVSACETRIATARREREGPTLDQIAVSREIGTAAH